MQDAHLIAMEPEIFSPTREFLFIIFVNAMFTTFMEPLFTKAFEWFSRWQRATCVWLCCIAD